MNWFYSPALGFVPFPFPASPTTPARFTITSDSPFVCQFTTTR